MFLYESIKPNDELLSHFQNAYTDWYAKQTAAPLLDAISTNYQDNQFGQILVDEQVFELDIILDDTFIKQKYFDLVDAFAKAGTFEAINVLMQAIFGEQVVLTINDKATSDEITEDYTLQVDIFQSGVAQYNFITQDNNLITDNLQNGLLFTDVFALLSEAETAFLLAKIVAGGVYTEFRFIDENLNYNQFVNGQMVKK